MIKFIDGDSGYGPEDNPHKAIQTNSTNLSAGAQKRMLRQWCVENKMLPYHWGRDKDNNVVLVIISETECQQSVGAESASTNFPRN